MSGTFNLSFVFGIFLLRIIIIQSVSGCEFYSTVPALGRTSYGIGSLYDGRTGNFLPTEFSVLPEKSRLRLNSNSKVISRETCTFSMKLSHFSLYRPSQKLAHAFEKPESGEYDREMGRIDQENYDGLALRAVLGMLEFPENGTAGFLLDKITQEEMTEMSTNYSSLFSPSVQDKLIFPGTGAGKNQNPHRKLLRREFRRNLKKMDTKILKRATHVVVKVIRGSKSIKSYTATSARIFRDDPASPLNFTLDYSLSSFFQALDALSSRGRGRGTTLAPSPPEGAPLAFALVPLLLFFSPSSKMKFPTLENWRNPIEIRHGRTFKNLDWTWQLIRQMAKLNTTFHKCLQENPKKDLEKAGEMIQELQNLHDNFAKKFIIYKRDLKSLLEKSSSGTAEDQKLWDLVYLKEDGAVGTGVHWDFFKELETAQQKVLDLGAENIPQLRHYSYKIKKDQSGVKRGCHVIPEIL